MTHQGALPFWCRYAELTDVTELQRLMNDEQREDYDPPFGTLTLILSGASSGAVAILAVIIAVQAAHEAHQARIAARASRARRLRYATSGAEVTLEKLPPESLEQRVRDAYPPGKPSSAPA